MRVAAMQRALEPGNVRKNLATAVRWAEAAAAKGAELIVLPELLAAGYQLEASLAEEVPDGPTTAALADVAETHGVTLVAGVLEQGAQRGVLYDTAIVVGRDGLIDTVRKARLWGDEHGFFARGPLARPVFDLGDVKIGVSICVEVVHPQISRQLAVDGAEVRVVVSAFGAPRAEIWDLMTRARAVENGCFLVASNLCGDNGERAFCGGSRVVGPRGDVRVDAGDGEGVAMVDIDLEEIVATRQELPYLRDHLS